MTIFLITLFRNKYFFQVVFVLLQAELPAFCAGSREPSMICEVHAKEAFDDEKNLDGIYSKMFSTLKETTRMPGKR